MYVNSQLSQQAYILKTPTSGPVNRHTSSLLNLENVENVKLGRRPPDFETYISL